MKNLFQSILQVGIFAICSQALLHFGPNGSYEKYLRILAGVMILIQIFLPILRLFPGEAGELEERMEYYQERLDEAMEDARKMAEQAVAAAEGGAEDIVRGEKGTVMDAEEREAGDAIGDVEQGAAGHVAEEKGKAVEEGVTGIGGAAEEEGKSSGWEDISIEIDRIEIELEGMDEDEGDPEEVE